METPQPSKVSSLPTLARTVENDFYCGQWFSYLLSQSPVKAALVPDENMRRQYRALARIEKQALLLDALLLLCLAGMLTPYRMAVIVLLAAWFWRSSYLTNKKKAIVVELGMRWLSLEFTPEDFERKTLYQLAEIISRKYGVASMVDTVYFNDTVFRILYTGWFVFLLVPYPIPDFAAFAGCSVLAVILIRNILNSRRVYQSHRMMDAV